MLNDEIVVVSDEILEESSLKPESLPQSKHLDRGVPGEQRDSLQSPTSVTNVTSSLSFTQQMQTKF